MKSHFDTGCVRIRLTCADGKVSAAQLSSERPDVALVLRGRTAEQAVQVVARLFALCGRAQAKAAKLALAAARGEACLPQLDSEVQREALREHLWHGLLDLPPLLGQDAWQQEFVSAVAWLNEGKRDELHALLASPRIAALRSALQQLDEPHPLRLLPPLDARSSLSEWPRLTAEFCRHPDWRGLAAESGAISRKNCSETISCICSRQQARFAELQDWAESNDKIAAAGTVSAVNVAPGIGRSLVETARGLLMHEATLDGERVADYRIVAPTEWNFHPQGALVGLLQGQLAENREQLKQRVALTVAALDPCVRWELEWA